MALDLTQRAQIRRHLGYSDISAGGTSPLETAMDVLSAESEVIVEEILADLATLRTTMGTARTRMTITRAEEVHFNSEVGMRELRAEGQRLLEELAAVFGVENMNTAYSGGPRSGVLRRGT